MAELRSVAQGVLLGGALGTAAAVFFSVTSAPQQQQDAVVEEESAAFVFDDDYAHLARDAALRSALEEPARLFASLDEALCRRMLQGFEDLAAIYAGCRGGEARSTALADALKARRQASVALAELTRLARRTRPAAASDVSEDLLAAQRYLADCVYNIDQEQDLRRSSGG
jgi:hypothetical protein